MNRILKIAMLILFTNFIACNKKVAETKFCWQIIDFAGNNLNTVCDKTEAELIECSKNATCGNYNGGSGLTSCNYYKIEGDKFCWLINNKYYVNLTENQAQLYAKCFFNGVNALKVDCGYCKDWYNREKRIYKPTSLITYSSISTKNYCGDTLKTIFQGRQITRKNDADSLIIIQFSNDGINW